MPSCWLNNKHVCIHRHSSSCNPFQLAMLPTFHVHAPDLVAAVPQKHQAHLRHVHLLLLRICNHQVSDHYPPSLCCAGIPAGASFTSTANAAVASHRTPSSQQHTAPATGESVCTKLSLACCPLAHCQQDRSDRSPGVRPCMSRCICTCSYTVLPAPMLTMAHAACCAGTSAGDPAQPQRRIQQHPQHAPPTALPCAHAASEPGEPQNAFASTDAKLMCRWPRWGSRSLLL